MSDPIEAADPLLTTDLHVEATNRLVEALVESENRMRRRLDLLADAVAETDASGALVFLNPAWTVLTGLTAEQCTGRHIEEFFPEESRADVRATLSERREAHRQLATRLQHAHGSTVRVVLTTSPIPSGGSVVVLRDVTREHAYQEELRKLSVVASSTSNLVIITDADGYIDWVNPAFERRTGYRLAEVRGRKPGAFLQGPGTDKETVERLRLAIAERRATSEEVLNYTKSGEPYWVIVNLTPVIDADGRLERFISVQADTTERKRVELLKKQFVSTVSHELRTPLTSISGALGLMAGGATGDLPEQALTMVDIAQKNGRRLTTLINDLLDMERLTEDGMPIDPRPQEVLPLVRQSVGDNQTYASEYGVTLVVDRRSDNAVIDIDAMRLMQVLANLISNACKFAPAGSEVTVRVRRSHETVRISVRDRGPGVPRTFQGDIFEKFSQVDASDTRSRGGTGLGLAISKELVERMDGTIGYDSVEGQGATFFVDFPICAPRR